MRRDLMVVTFAVGGLTAALLAAATPRATADDANSFYKGKSITFLVPNAAGGGYDVYVRTLVQFLPRHIRGNPSIIVEDIPAAGGIVMTNQLYVSSPKDGTYIGMVRGTVLQEELFKNPQVHFKGRKFNWLFDMNSDVDTCIVAPASGIKTIADFYTKQAVAGATGVGAQSYSYPIAYRKILGMKFKVISGYSGAPDRVVAMQRGEINTACGITVSTFRSQFSGFAKAGKIALVAQAGLAKDPRYPDLPNMLDQAKTLEQKQLLQLLFAPLALNRTIAAPPGVPADRVASLRKAMEDTEVDPDFRAAAQKVRVDIQSMTGAETEKAVDAMADASPDTIAQLKTIVGE